MIEGYILLVFICPSIYIFVCQYIKIAAAETIKHKQKTGKISKFTLFITVFLHLKIFYELGFIFLQLKLITVHF